MLADSLECRRIVLFSARIRHELAVVGKNVFGMIAASSLTSLLSSKKAISNYYYYFEFITKVTVYLSILVRT